MPEQVAARDFPADALYLSEIRRFVSDHVSGERAWRLRLLVNELAVLVIGMAPGMNVALFTDQDRLEIRITLDLVKDDVSLEPSGYCRQVIEALADEFTVHVGADDIYLSASLRSPSASEG